MNDPSTRTREKRRVRTIVVLPTLLTLGNAFCGFLALAYIADAIEGGHHVRHPPDVLLTRAAWLVFLAMVFDALDGKIARLTKADGQFGAELDSLCDVITFGLAPAYFVKVLAQIKEPSLFLEHPRIALWFSALFVMCAILRLARYNVENITGRKGPTHYFVGLPTPAAAGMLAALVLVYFELAGAVEGKGIARLAGVDACHTWANAILISLPFLTAVLGVLMISRVPFLHLVNALTGGRRSLVYIVGVTACGIVAVFLPEAVLALAFSGYVVISVIVGMLPGPRRRRMEQLAEEQEAEDDAEGFGP